MAVTIGGGFWIAKKAFAWMLRSVDSGPGVGITGRQNQAMKNQMWKDRYEHTPMTKGESDQGYDRAEYNDV